MTDKWRDSSKPGGWIPWRERLEGQAPGEWVSYLTSCRAVAKSTAHLLRCGAIESPPGDWNFRARLTTVQARYCGPAD